MSLKLTTSLSQRLVLTPQLRQRIEMLQMTSLELTDLIQQQLLENPVLEEVPTQEEVQEIAEKVLDHLTSSDTDSTFEAAAPEPGAPGTNGSSDTESVAAVAAHGDELTGAVKKRAKSLSRVKVVTKESRMRRSEKNNRVTLLRRSISAVSFKTI
jgi:DNA-directed RNA polymerase specialized sigma54-like protein